MDTQELKVYFDYMLSDCMYELERLVLSKHFVKDVVFTQEEIAKMHKDIQDKYNFSRRYEPAQRRKVSIEIDKYLENAFNQK